MQPISITAEEEERRFQRLRLCKLYHIINKKGECVPFRPNPVQLDLYDHLHRRNLVLKARQLGMSTFAVILLLDSVIFTQNFTAGIVSYSLEHAQHIFKRIIGHALDTFALGQDAPRVVQRSAKEITLANGSSIRVDTTLRGGSYQAVLVSEFGKTCARDPGKAEEIVTGTLQAVPSDGLVIIESTGEGSDGYFAEMVLNAERRGNAELSELDYRLFFYPWFREPSYSLEANQEVYCSQADYFAELERNGISLTRQQRNWYIKQELLLGDKVRQEYPSTVQEAFLSSSDAYYYAEAIAIAWKEGRCPMASIYDPLHKLYVAMDIGVNDLTVIVFFQCIHGEVRIVDYYEDSNKDCDFYAKFLLQDKRYLYDTIYLPHDSTHRGKLDVYNTYERDFRRLFEGTGTRVLVLPKESKQLGISHTRVMLRRMVFNASRCKPLLDQLAKYRKIWSESFGKYSEEPLHNIASNYADALRYCAQAVARIEASIGQEGALQRHKEVTAARLRRFY